MKPHQFGLKIAKAVLLASVGLALAGGLLRVLPRSPLDQEIDTSQARSSCEVLFLGPSYVKNQIRKGIVDAETARLGYPIKSCVFGMNSLSGYEEKAALRKILKEDWSQLRLVFVDTSLGSNNRIDEGNRYNARVVRWHDRDAIEWLYRYYSERKMNRESLGAFAEHVSHWVANSLRVGDGAQHLAQRIVAQERRGHGKQKVWSAKQLNRKLREVRRNKKKKPNRERQRWNLELVEMCRSYDFRCRIILAPVLRGISAKGSASDGVFVHDFNDPDRFAELYRVDARGETSHLSESGKLTYSKLLAREIVEILASEDEK